jgi:hypothetical protein
VYSFRTLIFSIRGDGPLEPYIAKARWICPSINPFVDITEAFYIGVPEALPEDGEEAR